MRPSRILRSVISLIIFQILIVQQSIGQNNNSTQISSKDATILNEENVFKYSGIKESVNLSVTKSTTVKIKSSNGAKHFSTIIVPEEFNKSYTSHSTHYLNDSFLYFDFKIKNFSVILTNSKGEIKKSEVKEKEIIDSLFSSDMSPTEYSREFAYQISNIEIGDVVQIDYTYEIPYILNKVSPNSIWGRNYYLNINLAKLISLRLFFNDVLYKENYKLTIILPKELKMEIFYKNNANPDSIIQTKDNKTYYWTRKNLDGCMDELGSRPYTSLPHIIYTVKSKAMEYTIFESSEIKIIPTYALLAHYMISVCSFYKINLANTAEEKFFDDENYKFDKYIVEETKDIENDSIGYRKLLKIHNKIVDDFSYMFDTNYYKGRVYFKPKVQDDLHNNLLRERNRYFITTKLIAKLKLFTFLAYTCDARSGEIGDEYFHPMTDTDPIIAIVLNNNTIHYALPKKSKFGYYLNELPFYFENTNSRFINHDDVFAAEKEINTAPRIIKLPNSTVTENVRMNNISVTVNVDSMYIKFLARVSLSGQYSTMTRGLYQCDFIDETINPMYHKKIWELNSGIDLKSSSINVVNKEFPYNSVVKALYQAENILSKSGDTIILNLENWFNHIIYPNMEITNRQLDFYTDFLGKDTYTYLIQFDKNVKLAIPFENISITNDLGELKISLDQVSPNTYKLTSFFVTAKDKIEKSKIQSVKDIYDKIQALNSETLKFILE